MDAQQRLLLERAWEALAASAEGCAPDLDAAADTAVLVGIGTVDYTSMSAHLGVGIHTATGKRLPLCIGFLQDEIQCTMPQ